MKIFYGWWVVATVVTIQVFGIGIGGYCVGVFVPVLAEHFDVGHSDIMIFNSMITVIASLSGPFIGRGLDGPRARTWLITCVLIFSAGIATLSMVNGVILAIVTVAFIAPGHHATALAGPSSAVRWFHKRRGTALGIAAIGSSIGGALMPPLAAALILALGWRQAAASLALLTVLVAVPLAIWVYSARPSDRGQFPDGGNIDPPETDSSQHEEKTFSLLGDLRFWLLVLPFTLSLSAVLGLAYNMPGIAQDKGFGLQEGAYLLTIYTVAGAIGKLALGAITDRVDGRFLFCFACISAGSGTGLMLAAPGYWALALGAFLIGLAPGGLIPVRGIILSRALGTGVIGRALGLFQLAHMPLRAGMPFYAAWAYDTAGNFDLAMQTFIGMFVLAALAMVFAYPALMRSNSADPVASDGAGVP